MSKPTNATELLRLIGQAADEQWEELDLSGMGRLNSSADRCKECWLTELCTGRSLFTKPD